MASIDVGMIKYTNRTEILIRLEVYTIHVGVVIKTISEIVEKYDLENKGGEK